MKRFASVGLAIAILPAFVGTAAQAEMLQIGRASTGAIAELEGWKPAELHRIFWERGFACYAEGSNKRLINKRLREKGEGE